MSDLVGNPEDRFFHNEAHIVLDLLLPYGAGTRLNCLTAAVLTGTHKSVLRAKTKKKKYIPLQTPVLLYKSGVPWNCRWINFIE